MGMNAQQPKNDGMDGLAQQAAPVNAGRAQPQEPANPAAKPSVFSASIDVLGTAVRAVCDPVAKVCFPPLQRHWEKKYAQPWPEKYAHRMLILDFTLLTLIAFLLVAGALWQFVLPHPGGSGAVTLEITGPGEVHSGAVADFAVSYTNGSAEDIGGAMLKVRLPEGAVVSAEDVEAQAVAACDVSDAGTAEDVVAHIVCIPVGMLPHGESRTAIIHARTYGGSGASLSASAEFTYWREGDTAPHTLRDNRIWAAGASVLRMTATGPERLVRGKQLTATFTVTNGSSRPVGPLALRLERPAEFVVAGLVPGAVRGAWEIPLLAPGESTEVRVTGALSGAQRGEAPVLDLGAYVMDDGHEVLLERARLNLNPLAAGFTVSQDIAASEQRGAFLPGERASVTVRYENTGSQTVRDVQVTLYVDGTLVANPMPQELTWTAAEVPALAAVAPGASGELKAEFTARGDSSEPLEVYALAAYTPDGETTTAKTSSVPTELPVATRIAVDAAALYYTSTGDQLGIGPLPPRVGQTTKYRVVLNVTNASGDARGVMLEAHLPQHAEWTGRTSVAAGQSLDYLPLSRRVQWDIGELSAVAGAEDEGVGASFEVAITPEPGNAGSLMTLLESIRVRGVDAATGVSLAGTAPKVTTDLTFDPRGAGKGVVVE